MFEDFLDTSLVNFRMMVTSEGRNEAFCCFTAETRRLDVLVVSNLISSRKSQSEI